MNAHKIVAAVMDDHRRVDLLADYFASIEASLATIPGYENATPEAKQEAVKDLAAYFMKRAAA